MEKYVRVLIEFRDGNFVEKSEQIIYTDEPNANEVQFTIRQVLSKFQFGDQVGMLCQMIDDSYEFGEQQADHGETSDTLHKWVKKYIAEMGE